MKPKFWVGILVLMVCVSLYASSSSALAGIRRAETPWSHVQSPPGSGNSSGNLSAVYSGGLKMVYEGDRCKLRKGGSSIAFKAKKMNCSVKAKDVLGNEWSCVDDKTIQCMGDRCPIGQCGVLGKRAGYG